MHPPMDGIPIDEWNAKKGYQKKNFTEQTAESRRAEQNIDHNHSAYCHRSSFSKWQSGGQAHT